MSSNHHTDEIFTQKRKAKNPIKFGIQLNEEQKAAKAIILENPVTVLKGWAGSGKAQPLTSKIYTPTGVVTMGELRIGDSILGSSGTTEVVGIFPQGVESIYQITCSDGSTVECSLEHLWTVKKKKCSKKQGSWEVITTEQLIEDLEKGVEYRLPNLDQPLMFTEKPLELDPYLLGILLSEGPITEDAVSFSTNEPAVLLEVARILEGTSTEFRHNINYDYRFRRRQRNNMINSVVEACRVLNLTGKLPYVKFVPSQYKYNSVENRVRLLQGLIEGDGYVTKKGSLLYNTGSKQLSDDVVELFQSLGGIVNVISYFPKYEYKGSKKTSLHLHYQLYITIEHPERFTTIPFKKERLEERAHRVKYGSRVIKNIKKIGQAPTQCIEVSALDSLYVTDNCILTHNTLVACQVGLDLLFTRQVSKIIISRPTVSKEDIGFLPGDIRDKMDPWLAPIYHNLYLLYSKEKIDKEIESGTIEIVPFAFMRGRAQPLFSKVMTPVGWTTIGELSPGAEVVGKDGRPYEVTSIHPQGKELVYRVTFSDETSTLASSNHLWEVQDTNKPRCKPKVRTTEDLLEEGLFQKNTNKKKWKIPMASPIEFQKKNLPVDPYVLGALLGDGCITTKNLGFSSADSFTVEKIQKTLEEGLTVKKRAGENYDYDISKITRSSWTKNSLAESLDQLKLIGCNSLSKFIPSEYLYASIDQRLSILRGLMDTDGSIFSGGKHTKRRTSNTAHYYTISEQLKNGVVFLVQSLGGTARVRERSVAGAVDRTYNHNCYDISIRLSQEYNPFSIPRKADLFEVREAPTRNIASIEPECETYTQCIAVNSPDSLYLTDDCIVTHNTFLDSYVIVDEAQNVTHTQMETILGRQGKGSKLVICGDMGQIDLKDKRETGLSFLSRVEEHVPGFKIVTLLKNHRHDIVTPILQVYQTFRD